MLSSKCSKLQANALIDLPYWAMPYPDVDAELFLNPQDQIMVFSNECNYSYCLH